YDETGTYSGSPLAPTLSSVSASPNPVDAGQTTTFSNNAYAEDVNGGTFHWSGLVTSSSSNPTYSGGSGGTESMYYSTDAGSTSTYSTTLTVNSDPTISASANVQTIDAGQSVSFSSSPSGGTTPYSYTWYEEISGGSYSSFSTSQNPSYTFSSAGTYYVYVHLTDNAGYGVNSNTITITVNSDPSVSASSNLNPADAGQTIQFSSSVSGGSGGGSYTWYSGSTSDQIGTGSSYSTSFSAGTYSIFVVYVDSAGYSVTSNTITETVNSDPSVSISSSQNPTDIGNSVTFSSSVSGGTPGYSYSWSINGNAYTTSDVSVSFGSSGTYAVSLTVTDAAGYTVTQTLDETVNPDPTVTATASVSSADIGYSIEFSSTPSGGSGSYGYSWTLNGNQISTTQDFSYSFSSAGSYTLTVTITDSVGVESSATVTVTINDNPSVSISSSQNPTDVGNSVTFSSSVTGGTGTDTYSWAINGVQESTASQFSYSFSSAGTYYVNVTVTDSDGHTASYSFTEIVNPDPSVAIHVVHSPTDAGIWANFSSSISGGTPGYSYSWTINSQIFTTAYVNYTFTSSGTFAISLTVTDANGNQATADVNEVVNPDPSVAIEGQYATVDQGINDTLFAQVTGGTSPFNYTWSLGSTILNYSQEFHLQFVGTGTFQVNLTVRDSLGEATSTSYTVTVIAKPSALIEGPNNTDKSTTTYWEGYGSYGTAPYNYYWYLNGVNTSSGLYFQYSFPDTGGYNISLLIVDSQGSRAYAYLDITVDQLPSVTVTESRSATDAGIPVYFNASVSGGTPFFNYTWSISGIGFVGYQQSLVYAFSSAGYYNITVKISDGSGNSASASIEIRINALPSVAIAVQYPNIDPDVTDSFNSIVTGGTPGYSYAWYVNGSLSGSTGSLNYSFARAGIYPVRLVVQDSQGLSASYVTDVTVVPYPQASIIPSRTSLDANVSDEFRASGTGGVGPYSYEWVIGGHAFTNSTVSYSFQSPGNYTVQLVISDSFGMDASSSVAISVYKDPTIQVSWTGKAVVSEEFPLYANVTGGIAPYGISWIFPSGQHETGSSIDHVFSSSGPDIFEVQVSDQGGFIQTRNFTIDVGLYVAVAANQTSGLGPLAVQFS
ncbi:MAG: PKD domain-containing protein, partial [Thermoplasmata archaeon]|nr:PKD domain-containing protein [Candidatus Sysuiplasma jiujiangense]